MERTRVSFSRADATGRRGVVGLALAAIAALAAALPGAARGQEPAARPKAEAAPAPLARYVPKQDSLFFYFELDGLDAHQAAWQNSAAYKLLHDTKLGALVEDLAAQGIEAVQQSAPPNKQVKPAELIALFKHAAKRGFAIGFWGQNPEVGGFVIVARDADRPDVLRLIEMIKAGGPQPDPVQHGGRTLHPINERVSWWIEKGDLIFSSSPEIIFSVLDGQSPNASDHPVRTALLKKADGLEPVAVGFLDIAALPPMPPQAAQLGLDGLKRIDFQWGIQDDAMLAVVGLAAPQPRRGILALLDQPTFTVNALPPLPAGVGSFMVLSLDPGKLYDQVVDLVKQTNPQGGEGFAQLELALRQRFGFDLRQDILGQIGPRFALYSRAPAGADAGNPALAIMGQFTGLTIAAQARDEALARNFDKLIQAINLIIQSQQAAARRGQPDPDAGAIAFRKQDAKRPTYVLDLPQGGLPPQVLAMFRPTVELGNGQLVVGATTAVADQAIDVAARPADRLWKPADAFVPMARRLPPDLVFLTVSDPRETLPAFVDNLPVLVQMMNLTFPAVQSARGAARRAQCTNNLKMIGLAMHNYIATNNTFPPPAISGKDGKPALSWRVAILPFLEQQPLYEKFHLDEPWDSPHNKALINEMPPTYVCPSRANVQPGTTTYRVFVGKGAFFEKDRATGLADITDGTSNTIMVVEANEAVPWTRPDSDLPFDPEAKASLYGAGSAHPGGFNVLMGDGSVRFISGRVAVEVFRALVTRGGGEVVNAAAF